jgi:hypothetical protein
MSEKMLSRRGVFTLLGIAALGFAVPTTVLTTATAIASRSSTKRSSPVGYDTG